MAIGHEGIIVFLIGDDHQLSYPGWVRVVLPYEELGAAFLLWEDTPPALPQESGEEPSAQEGQEEPPPPEPLPVPAPPPSPGLDPSRPMIALTFDDGPSPYTDQILDLLERYGGRATFAVLGNRLNSRPQTVTRAVAGGSEIVNHSWSHRDLTKLSEQGITAEITDTSALILQLTGTSPTLMRPPYGASSDLVRSTCADLGYAILLWSVDTLDWKHRDSNTTYNVIVENAADGAIILLHDIHAPTAQAMERVIPRLIADGFQLVTASELLYHRYGALQPGAHYYGAGR